MNSKYLKIGGAIVALLAMITAWWFLYYTKTPTYSLGIVRKAVQQHDLDTFKKHVDLDTLMDKAIDDLLASDDQYNEMKNNPFATGLIQMLKPTVVDIVKKKVYSVVETGKDSVQSTANNNNEYANGIANNISVDNNKTFVGVGKTTKDGKIATVELIVNDEDLGKEFTYVINMRELNDGTWQVTGIENLAEYFKELKQAHLQQLEEYIESVSAALEADGRIKELNEIGAELNQKQTYEKLTKFADLRHEINESVKQIKVPPGAKEFSKIAQQMEETNDIIISFYIKEINNNGLTMEENNQRNDAINKLNELEQKRISLLEPLRKKEQ